MEEKDIKILVISCLEELYQNDHELFKNGTRCERCLTFRFAHYLQNYLCNLSKKNSSDIYYVDCDYDASTNKEGKRIPSKKILQPDKTKKRKYIDLIVHGRQQQTQGQQGYFCIEFKTWKNTQKTGKEKDINNLKAVTSF